MSFEVDKAGVSVVSTGEDEEVVVHPTDHPKVGELEHFVHDPHHLHIKYMQLKVNVWRYLFQLRVF